MEWNGLISQFEQAEGHPGLAVIKEPCSKAFCPDHLPSPISIQGTFSLSALFKTPALPNASRHEISS